MRQSDQVRARVGDGRAAGFRDQTDILAGQKGRDQGFQCAGRRVFVEFQQRELLDRHGGGQLLQECARGLGLLDDKGGQAGGDAAGFFG